MVRHEDPICANYWRESHGQRSVYKAGQLRMQCGFSADERNFGKSIFIRLCKNVLGKTNGHIS